jgi:hypothetical protein
MASFVMSVLRLEPPWYHKYQGDLRSAEGGVMLGKYKIALAMIGSFAFGAVAAQSLNAQLGLLPMWLPKLTSKTARNLKHNFSLLLSKPFGDA